MLQENARFLKTLPVGVGPLSSSGLEDPSPFQVASMAGPKLQGEDSAVLPPAT